MDPRNSASKVLSMTLYAPLIVVLPGRGREVVGGRGAVGSIGIATFTLPCSIPIVYSHLSPLSGRRYS